MSDAQLRRLRRRLAADPEDQGAAEGLRSLARRLGPSDEARAFGLFFEMIASGHIAAEDRVLGGEETEGLGPLSVLVTPACDGEAAIIRETHVSAPTLAQDRLWVRGKPLDRDFTAWGGPFWINHTFSEDGRRCVLVRSPGRSSSLAIWDAAAPEPRSLPTEGSIGAVAFEDGAIAVSRYRDVLRLSYPGLLSQERLSTPKDIFGLVSNNGRLYGASEHGTLLIARGNTMRILATDEHGPGFMGFCVSPDGERFASFGRGPTLLLRAKGAAPRLLRGHEASGPAGASAEPRAEVGEPQYRAFAAAFSPGGQVLLSACHGGRLIAWSAVDGREIARLDGFDPISHVVVRVRPPGFSIATLRRRFLSWRL